jgi:outer membrane receptor protein involved in Fe transport
MPFVFYLLVFFSSFSFLAETNEELTVSTNQNWNFKPSSETISSDEIRFLNVTHNKELLNTSAGSWISRGSGQESLISLRSPVLTGSGACGSFLILEDGLPIRPAGFCNVNNLFEVSTNLSSRVEILKGPSSARFGGNALHGAINFQSLKVDADNYLKTEVNNDESFKASFQYQEATNWSLGVALDRDQGFRDSSGFDQQKLAFKSKNNTKNWQATTFLNLTNINQETAGYISSYKSELRLTNANPEAYRDAKSLRFNALLTQIKNNFEFQLRPYLRYSKMDFIQHYLPGMPVEKNSQTSSGLNFLMDVKSFLNHKLSFGINFEMAGIQLEEFQENKLTTSSAFNNAVRPQGLHYDFEVDTNLIALFLSHEFTTDDDYKIFSNIRTERLNYDYDNLMLDGRTRADGSACGFGGCYYSRPADTDISFSDSSFRFGFSRQVMTNEFFLQFSKGFRPPQINELFRLQKGQALADLNSEKIDSLEFGILSTGDNFLNKFVVFSSKKINYIYKDNDASTVTGGKSKHQGIEISGSVDVTPMLMIKYAWSFAEHVYDYSFSSIGVYEGNLIDTAPKVQGSMFFNIFPLEKLTLQIEEEYLGKYFTDPANQYSYPGHYLTNFRGFYNLTSKLDINFSILNVFNKRYAERADFSSFSGQRYFPGLPLQWRFGFSYSF